MVDSIPRRHRLKVKRIDALQTSNVVAVLIWIGAALMMRVDAAYGTEVVLRGSRVEVVQLENFSPL